jgi:hypothetical protein
VPATDSRSYRNSRKHARPEDRPASTGGHAAAGTSTSGGARHASDPLTSSGSYNSGGYSAAATDPGDGYSPAAPAATGTHASWYPAPAAETQVATPPYGNPYSSNGTAAEPAAGYGSVDYPHGYAADTGGQYQQPGYTAPPTAPYAAPPEYQSSPPAGTPAQYSGPGYLSQSAGYPAHPGYYAESQSPGAAMPNAIAPYPDAYPANGYAGGHEHPYTAGGYGYEG